VDFDKYNKKHYYGDGYKKKRFGKKTFIFLVFSFVLVTILFSAFYGNGGITGNVIGSINQNNSIEIKTSFSVPEVSLDDEYKEIVLTLNKGGVINLDDKKITLEENENQVILKNFKGEIKIDENNIKYFKGKISEIKINNLPVIKESGKLKISLSQNSKYSFFQIEEGVYLKNVFFITSGNINVGEDSLNLNSEKVEIKNYFGSLTLENKKLIFNGLVESINIEGGSRKVTLSK
jgi:hypothetical protein